jgi:hypothetical protein
MTAADVAMALCLILILVGGLGVLGCLLERLANRTLNRISCARSGAHWWSET